RLSAVDLYHRGGAAGSIDARLDPIAWGVKDGRKLAAPITEIDHLRNGFDGGRWVFLAADLSSKFWATPETPQLLVKLAERPLLRSEEFIVRPLLPLSLRGEPIQLEIKWHSATPISPTTKVKIAIFPEDQASQRSESIADVQTSEPFILP